MRIVKVHPDASKVVKGGRCGERTRTTNRQVLFRWGLVLGLKSDTQSSAGVVSVLGRPHGRKDPTGACFDHLRIDSPILSQRAAPTMIFDQVCDACRHVGPTSGGLIPWCLCDSVLKFVRLRSRFQGGCFPWRTSTLRTASHLERRVEFRVMSGIRDVSLGAFHYTLPPAQSLQEEIGLPEAVPPARPFVRMRNAYPLCRLEKFAAPSPKAFGRLCGPPFGFLHGGFVLASHHYEQGKPHKESTRGEQSRTLKANQDATELWFYPFLPHQKRMDTPGVSPCPELPSCRTPVSGSASAHRNAAARARARKAAETKADAGCRTSHTCLRVFLLFFCCSYGLWFRT